MSRLSSERAKTALHILILVNILIFVYRDNLRPHLNLQRTYRIHDGNFRSMLLSIFYHMEPTHLFMNMIALYRYGSELFVNSSSRKWQSVFVVIISYVACGIGAFVGIELLSRYHEYQWEQKLSNARYAGRCNHWLCKSLNDAWGEDISSYFTNALADITTSFQFADIKLSMWYYQVIYRIGASGVVYGWMGMRLVTSWMSPYHSKMSMWDYVFLIATLAHDLNESPITLEDLRMSALLEGDGVDHTAHIMGTVFGMIWALVFILWEKVTTFGLFGGDGGGGVVGEVVVLVGDWVRGGKMNKRYMNNNSREDRTVVCSIKEVVVNGHARELCYDIG
eukprot:CAMPEP_0201875540 /NCGR_PEP_ID=MMETSP0902-20130614/7496_1 /ASSEMBLY_ACC=CAM_ASM_000551 /TAXON_ID=420261 /ORGANISM="Thalassiosira antarctica, Strain CCMP982" /LENGTH=335 /DNA_ID=CAMNT_0048402621 /DNA_START=76 /DNA_END=1084 /DNA_ORIENTATION=+